MLFTVFVFQLRKAPIKTLPGKIFAVLCFGVLIDAALSALYLMSPNGSSQFQVTITGLLILLNDASRAAAIVLPFLVVLVWSIVVERLAFEQRERYTKVRKSLQIATAVVVLYNLVASSLVGLPGFAVWGQIPAVGCMIVFFWGTRHLFKFVSGVAELGVAKSNNDPLVDAALRLRSITRGVAIIFIASLAPYILFNILSGDWVATSAGCEVGGLVFSWIFDALRLYMFYSFAFRLKASSLERRMSPTSPIAPMSTSSDNHPPEPSNIDDGINAVDDDV